ncbi:MAG: hypothetical protein KGO02_16385 [Alphaproteobacteria bacterium]|nr:hypothetical protein [Alphaproteobacteria bacterium]
MSNYIFRILDANGRLAEEIAVMCDDDFAALDQAALLARGHSVEIWCGARLLTHRRADGEAALDALNRPQTWAAMAVRN